MYRPGDHYAICDICGFRYFASEMKMQWDNLFVCVPCFSPKHPQWKQPSGLHEKQTVEISRNEKTDTFITDANDGEAWDGKTNAITADDL